EKVGFLFCVRCSSGDDVAGGCASWRASWRRWCRRTHRWPRPWRVSRKGSSPVPGPGGVARASSSSRLRHFLAKPPPRYGLPRRLMVSHLRAALRGQPQRGISRDVPIAAEGELSGSAWIYHSTHEISMRTVNSVSFLASAVFGLAAFNALEAAT